MKISEAAKPFLYYHRSHSKENSVRSYMLALHQLCKEFSTERRESIIKETMLYLLNMIAEGKK